MLPAVDRRLSIHREQIHDQHLLLSSTIAQGKRALPKQNQHYRGNNPETPVTRPSPTDGKVAVRPCAEVPQRSGGRIDRDSRPTVADLRGGDAIVQPSVFCAERPARISHKRHDVRICHLDILRPCSHRDKRAHEGHGSRRRPIPISRKSFLLSLPTCSRDNMGQHRSSRHRRRADQGVLLGSIHRPRSEKNVLIHIQSVLGRNAPLVSLVRHDHDPRAYPGRSECRRREPQQGSERKGKIRRPRDRRKLH